MPASPAAHPKITNHPASAAFRHPRGVQKQALSPGLRLRPARDPFRAAQAMWRPLVVAPSCPAAFDVQCDAHLIGSARTSPGTTRHRVSSGMLDRPVRGARPSFDSTIPKTLKRVSRVCMPGFGGLGEPDASLGQLRGVQPLIEQKAS